MEPLWQFVVTFCNVTTIALCMVCKVPQIKTVISAGSAGKGLSVNSVMVELFGLGIVLGYNIIQNYPLMTYLETGFMFVQDILLILVIFHTNGSLNLLKLGGLGALLAMFYGLIQGIPHPSALPILMRLTTFIFAYSKILQLRAIWSSRSSQTVSVTTWTITAYRCVARLTTNILLMGDVPLMINHSVALVLNALVVASALYFRMEDSTEMKLKSENRKKVA